MILVNHVVFKNLADNTRFSSHCELVVDIGTIKINIFRIINDRRDNAIEDPFTDFSNRMAMDRR